MPSEAVVGCFLTLLLGVVVHVGLVWTGEIVLWAVSLGRWRPEFMTSPIEAELLLRPTLWVGVVFWSAIGVAIWALW